MIVLDGVQERIVHTDDVKSWKEILHCSDVISHQRQLQRRVRQLVSTTTRCNQGLGSHISQLARHVMSIFFLSQCCHIFHITTIVNFWLFKTSILQEINRTYS